jgi:putative ATP-dependent endonuclease of the OLD family
MKARLVLLFEEPETHLHPHLQRRMKSVLERLAASGWHVITTTHSPEFVSLGSKQRVVKVRRHGEQVAASEFETAMASDAVRLQAKIDEHGNGELFFANKVIICEGKDDEFALKLGLEKRKTDLDGRSVSVIGVGGKGNLVDYAELLGQLGIPWCAVLDQDRLEDGSYKPGTQAIVKRIGDLRSDRDRLLQWEIDLEHCYGISRDAERPDRPERKADPERQYQRAIALTWPNMNADHPLLAQVVLAAQEWIER